MFLYYNINFILKKMNDKNNLLLLIFLFISIISIQSYIIIPFKEIKKNEVYDFKDVDELINEVSYLNLYTDFYLGSTPYKLPTLIRPNIDYFAIIKNDEEEL